ncbi:alpha-(1-_3)-arabinofuranosyltransferase [Nocardioides sp.]|uniref:alpha-(1->3)-arabinofuranosyltransferase n=1 Tax=Nocardioides sp. TaxID=35761 RepID=UPI00286D88FB|nr:alpha-(1->3)-arabinofuranosyltransferase [Nocardioides sp.]
MTGETTTKLRWRLLAGCAILLGLAMTQSPGLLVPDTKLDLAIAPIDFLARAGHFWDAEGAFGQLQNQAYGYLWPMGPFFVIGDLLGLPEWVVQRLWVALVMVVAFVGAAVVSRRLGVRSDLACLLAGFAYALSPRMLTVLGPISIEAWPSALAPWVLLPLIIGAERGSPRRAAALSALAVAMVGGVNAAATSAVLPLGALWLLTRAAGPRRRSMMVWWPFFTALGTLWWLIPLFVLGAYSPPFLDYIEAAANTTFPTSLFDALRGTSNWVPFVDSASRAGNDLIRQPYLVMNSVVLLMLGLIGLSLRRNPHRGFLLSGVGVGVFLVTMGHQGAVEGWFAPQLQDLLDGPLAPLRNVHKFDPVIRLPLVIGLAFCVSEITERLAAARVDGTASRGDRINFRTWVTIAVVAVIGAALPMVVGRVAPAAAYSDVPGYWYEAAQWLGDEDDPGVALLVPGSSFGSYVWGSPRDEPFQALATTPWAVRNAVPLAPAGNIRMLDAIETRLAQGRGSPGLTAYLRRAGVSHLVMRNDLSRGPDIPDPVLVHQAIDDSPGLALVAEFGPNVGGAARIEGELGKAMVNGGWQSEYAAIEIFAVTPTPSPAETTSRNVVVVGGPEDLLDLADLGVLGDAPVQLAADQPEPEPGTSVILTDGLRNVERNFGRLHDSSSATRSASEAGNFSKFARDYLLPDADRWSTSARIHGAASVTASSSQSDANAYGAVQPGELPYAALDGDPSTAWSAGAVTEGGRWWQVEFETPVALGQVSITVTDDGNEELRVVTDDWESPPLGFRPNDTRRVAVPGTTKRLRIEDLSGRPDNRLAITEIVSDRIDVTRELVLPDLPDGVAPDLVVLRRLMDARNGCAVVETDVRCLQGQASTPEERTDFHRAFTLPDATEWPVSIRVSARPGRAFDRIALTSQAVSVIASSVGNVDQRSGPVAAIDGDPHTTWTSSLGEIEPELDFDWLGKRTISGIALNVAQETAARAPQSVRLLWRGGSKFVELNDSGSARFSPIRTNHLTVHVIDAEPASDIRFDGSTRLVPVGISELVLTGLPYIPVALPTTAINTACGTGPRLEVNGASIPTRVVGTPADMFAGAGAEAVPCGSPTVALKSGANAVAVLASDAFVADSVVLGASATADAGSVVARQPSPVTIDAEPTDAGPLVTHMNVNEGWDAEQSGAELTPVVFDGWRQGWTTRSDQPVEARFGPDLMYRLALALGLVGVLTLIVVSLRRPGRAAGEPPAIGPRRASGGWLGLSVLGAGALLAGPAGLVTSTVALGAGLLLFRRAPAFGGAWAAVLLIPVGGAYFVRPWGSGSGWAGHLGWPQLLVLAACCVAAGWVAADFGAPRWPKRTPGSSTTR